MYKARSFQDTDLEELEKELNSFFSLLKEGELIDIKYDAVPLAVAAHQEHRVYPRTNYTAVVIYKKTE